jgi:hypothetical protein
VIVRRLAVLTLALTGAVAWAGCPEVLSHIYFGGLYDPDADCIYPETPVDPALAGPPEDGGVCDAICIANEAGRVFISPQCPPYPTTFDLDTGSLPACKAAFEALAACRRCPLEGGPIQIFCDVEVPDVMSDVAKDAPPEAEKDASKDGEREAQRDGEREEN